MKRRSLYLAAYDVSEPARLVAILKTIRRYATGGQKSVYECFLNKKEARDLFCDVQAIIDSTTDRFFLIRLDIRSAFRALGVGATPEDKDFFYHG